MTIPFDEFFRRLTVSQDAPEGRSPFPYQERLATNPWPTVLDIPTGLGKTAAVVLSWLYKRLSGEAEAGMRLVYCLPMRVLVEQTEAAARGWCERARPLFQKRGLPTPTVHLLMGGEADNDWDACPDAPAILIGTQDMLLSRALNRGYGLSRYRWPTHFALLSNDATWVFDETQLMGVGVETSAQLHALRQRLGANGVAASMWMSATLGEAQLSTVDHPRPDQGWSKADLEASDLANAVVRQRVSAKKSIARLDGWRIEKESAKAPSPDRLAEIVRREHDARGGLTLVVLNQVARARALYLALKADDDHGPPIGLLHSRFRAEDRARHAALLHAEGDRIIVATQVVEAGVDVSASTLITELAPWSSLVQRFGRCNRYGEVDAARILWIDIDTADPKAQLALPYEAQDLDEARELLDRLSAQGGDAGPAALRELPYAPREVIRPVLRRRDLVDLFDTTADLCGDDIDVSRYVRDGDDTDVHFYWRDVEEAGPSLDVTEPHRVELCRVQIGRASEFLKALEARRRKLRDGSEKDRGRAKLLRAWLWNPVAKKWETTTAARPGQVLLLHPIAGGYHPDLGWSGEVTPKEPVPTVAIPDDGRAGTVGDHANDSDVDTGRWGRWVSLRDHLAHVSDEARRLAEALPIDAEFQEALSAAGLWHDVGKAHAAFQHQLLAPLESRPEIPRPEGEGPWAKSSHTLRTKQQRPGFRHELASALAWLAATTDDDSRVGGVRSRDLVAYLIAAHHGKVRLSIRSLPGEAPAPGEGERLVARGVWDGEELPPFELPDGQRFEGLSLDLSLMRMGKGSWLERMLALRDADAIGPFRLAFLETIVRAADWRASKKEQEGAYDDA